MDELREQHLGIERAPGSAPVFDRLQAAYETVLAEAG
jgi:hypothetical protein